jgi:NADH-quinone oxidoreductase subunit N
VSRFAALLPELILSIGGTILMLVAAFAGRRGSTLVHWLAVALLIAATAALVGPPSHAGPIYDGLIAADLFASFGKAIIFPAAAVAIIAAHGWFERGTEHSSEYAVLIVFSAVGMSVMVSATSLISLYVGLELQSLAAYVLASYRRTDERSAEAGLKYFVLGALASGILLYGISLLYGFAGTMNFTGLAAAFGRGAPSLGAAVRPGVPARRPGVQDQRGSVPHVDSRRLRRRADARDDVLRDRAQGRRGDPRDAGLRRRARAGDRRLAADRDRRRTRLDLPRRSCRLGQTNIKRLLAYSSINNVGFALIGLAAGGAQGASSVLFYMAVYVVMTLGAFLCVLWMRDEDGRPIESIASLSGLAQTRPALAAAFAIFMFSLAGIPPLFGFWPKLLVFNAAVASGLTLLAVAGILGTVVGAYYYLRIVKTMYMDEPAAPYKRLREPVQGLLILLTAVIVSPLGYLLAGPLSSLTDKAAGSLF